jgi:integrase
MEMGPREITQFLNALAVRNKVAASTQNQALSALLFLYRAVLEQDVPRLDDLVRAKRRQRLPVVLTRDEVRAILDRLHGVPLLMALLLYGAGLACSSAPVSGSRTWISSRIRSWSGTARVTRIA